MRRRISGNHIRFGCILGKSVTSFLYALSRRSYKVVFSPQIVKLCTKRFSGRGNNLGRRDSALGLRRHPQLSHLFRTLQSGALQGPDSLCSNEGLLQEEKKLGLVARRTISVPQFVVSVPQFHCYLPLLPSMVTVPKEIIFV